MEDDLLSSELKISDNQDHPFALFCYDPKDEFQIRKEFQLLKIRLRAKKKEIFELSLADIFWKILEKEGFDRIFQSERNFGLERMIDTINGVLSGNKEGFFEERIIENIPEDLEPENIILITRVGVLFPVYRASSILSNLHRKIHHQTVLLYPGKTFGEYGLSFMGLHEPNYDYREKKY